MRSLPALAAVLALSSVGALAQTDLPKSKQCGFRDGGFAYAGGYVAPITMIMKKRPAHGQISITVLSGGTNVYYKPDPGYAGPDSFAVLNETYNVERVYNVVVR
jgi:hypothetical protein